MGFIVLKTNFEDKEMFRVTIPLLRDERLDEKDLINLANDTLNDTLNGTLNDTLKLILSELKNILFLEQKM